MTARIGGPKLHTDGMSRRQRRAYNAMRRLTEPNYAAPGRKAIEPLDPNVDRPQPLLVVTKPLNLHQVAHQYVASMLIECNGNLTQVCRTLGLSIGGLRRYMSRIENGTVGSNQLHILRAKGKSSGKTLCAVCEAEQKSRL